MNFRTIRNSAAAAVGALFINACASPESPTAPQSPIAPSATASSSLLGLSTTTTTVTPLQRTKPLAKDLSASANIGALGGKLAIPGAGITVLVPPLALTSTKLVTVTALAGSNVAYTFEPHGTKFLVPLVVTQDLSNTQAKIGGLINPLSLFVGYFPDSNNILSVTELLNINLNLLNQTAVFTVTHFSGYIVASGRQ
jgi:hypothetical protein